MDKDYFGCYHDFYSDGIRYLGLLNIGGEELKLVQSAKMLKGIVVNKNWENDSIRLLNDNNWRSQLAPTVSYLLLESSLESINAAIWKAVKHGSWISPQLLAALSITDKNFINNTTAILKDGIVPIQGDALTLHTEKGPGNSDSRIGKIANSLLGLHPELLQVNHNKYILEMARADFDNADEIAKEWKESVQILIKNCS